MDLVKIGKYIAGKRKELGLTQKQLAEKLGMSDKSVSKWERGICLPDVSVYSDLCRILGININEFLAGEDIPEENLIRKSEENIIGVASDSKKRQTRSRVIISALIVVSILALAFIGMDVFRKTRPQNFIVPLDGESIEMQTARLLAGPEEILAYRFTTTDKYKMLRLKKYIYSSGKLTDSEKMEVRFDNTGSPASGEILIVPDFEHSFVRIIIVSGGSRYSTEYPLLEGVNNRENYGRSWTQISGRTDIRYNEEQALAALIYDDDEMRVPGIENLIHGDTDSLMMNDYVYFFSFEFSKK